MLRAAKYLFGKIIHHAIIKFECSKEIKLFGNNLIEQEFSLI